MICANYALETFGMVSLSLHEDILSSFRHDSKFSKLLIVSLHKIWVGRYSLMHTQVDNEVAIEEHNDLKSEATDAV